jgi:hypothetical protein
VLVLDSTTLRFPYPLRGRCNSVYLNFNVVQDNTAFYGQGISQAWLSVNDSKPIAQTFRIDRIDSENFAPLATGDFNTQPNGPVVARSIVVSSRLVPAGEMEAAFDTLNRNHCNADHRDQRAF